MKPITLPFPGLGPITICISKTHLRNATSPGQAGSPSPPGLASPPHPNTQPCAPEHPRPTGPSAGRSRPRDEGRCEIFAPLHCAAQGGRATGPDPSLQPVVAQRVWNKSPRHQNVPPLAEATACSRRSRHKGLHPSRYPPLHRVWRSIPSLTGAFLSDQLSLIQLKKK